MIELRSTITKMRRVGCRVGIKALSRITAIGWQGMKLMAEREKRERGVVRRGWVLFVQALYLRSRTWKCV